MGKLAAHSGLWSRHLAIAVIGRLLASKCDSQGIKPYSQLQHLAFERHTLRMLWDVEWAKNDTNHPVTKPVLHRFCDRNGASVGLEGSACTVYESRLGHLFRERQQTRHTPSCLRSLPGATPTDHARSNPVYRSGRLVGTVRPKWNSGTEGGREFWT